MWGYLKMRYGIINKNIIIFIDSCIEMQILKYLEWFNNFFEELVVKKIENVKVNKVNVIEERFI